MLALRVMVNIDFTECDDMILRQIALVVMKVKTTKQFPELSRFLSNLDLISFSDIILVGLLRNTFSIRSRICWNELFIKIEQILLDRGRDPVIMLRFL